jgi:CHAT domain-containing protein
LLVVPSRFGTHVVAIGKQRALWTRSDWSEARIRKIVDSLLQNLGAEPTPGGEGLRDVAAPQGPRFSRQTAFELYLQLIAPSQPVLAGVRRLYIAAGGPLARVPFAALVTAKPAGSDEVPDDLRRTKWLIDAFAVVNVPSAYSLQLLRRNEAEGAGGTRSSGALRYVGFGNPDLLGSPLSRGDVAAVAQSGEQAANIASSAGIALADPSAIRQMAQLPGTAVELEAMRRALHSMPASIFTSDQATEQRVRSTDLQGANILTFATHALTATESGAVGEPAIVLTPPEQASLQDDGLLTAPEIATLSIPSDLVILSACNSASTGPSEFSAYTGLVRSFFFAGARNLFASHWPVRDDVAAHLPARVMQIMTQDKSVTLAEALQRATREVRGDTNDSREGGSWSHPFAWAAFTLVGDGERPRAVGGPSR